MCRKRRKRKKIFKKQLLEVYFLGIVVPAFLTFCILVVSTRCPLLKPNCVFFPTDYMLLDKMTWTGVLFCPLGGNTVCLAGEQGINGQYQFPTVCTSLLTNCCWIT